MKPEEIHLSDFYRIFVGEVPASFYIELFIRTLVIYIILIVSMRFMGKRMSAQLGRNEMAALVSLAAAIGVPLQAPDRGLLPALVIAFVIIIFQNIISKYATKNQHFEQLTQDDFSILVENSRMNLDKMINTRISRERLFAQLRSLGVTHLGIVKRLYLEANGSFTLVKNNEPGPGLNILPEKDEAYSRQLHKITSKHSCKVCGFVLAIAPDADQKCPHCQHHHWEPAVE